MAQSCGAGGVDRAERQDESRGAFNCHQFLGETEGELTVCSENYSVAHYLAQAGPAGSAASWWRYSRIRPTTGGPRRHQSADGS